MNISKQIIKGFAWSFIILGIVSYPVIVLLDCLRGQCLGGYIGEHILVFLIIQVPFLVIGICLLLSAWLNKLFLKIAMLSVAIIILSVLIYLYIVGFSLV